MDNEIFNNGVASFLNKKNIVRDNYIDFSKFRNMDDAMPVECSEQYARNALNNWCVLKARGDKDKANELRRCFSVGGYVRTKDNTSEYETAGRSRRKYGYSYSTQCTITMFRPLPDWAR